ncbi:hypothetical protein BDCR2A_01521 [Borrelia duttonii CR2A]|uniref:Uncharacterized protein n=1 Tax=Borrelia duttonii CR2A TaxID=1432657 RepID=W6TFL4_9SPIR|nr:hypothetical protein [Borrelia duttonii]ETZ17552.1 hypothetical protein BDCR2A_01521 [Borrelia duttonii CR2A]
MGIISHMQSCDDCNKANISNINKKNSKNSIKKKSLKNSSCKRPKSEKIQFKQIGIKTRLIDVHKISRNYMQQVKELSNND